MSNGFAMCIMLQVFPADDAYSLGRSPRGISLFWPFCLFAVLSKHPTPICVYFNSWFYLALGVIEYRLYSVTTCITMLDLKVNGFWALLTLFLAGAQGM